MKANNKNIIKYERRYILNKTYNHKIRAFIYKNLSNYLTKIKEKNQFKKGKK